MKFFFNGGGFMELTTSLREAGHEIARAHPWSVFAGDDKTWHSYNTELLKQEIIAEKPDVYICSKGFKAGRFIYPETTEWIAKNVATTIYWSLDDPFFMPTFLSRHMYRGYKLALSCSTSTFPEYRKVGIQPHLFWPAWDTMSRTYQPIPEEKKIDLVFVGTPYACTDPPRKDFVLWAAESGWSIEIYGSNNWVSSKVIQRHGKPFIQGDERLQPYYRGVWDNWITLPTLFSKARINFSNHVQKADMYLNDRVPLIMGVGGCLVMDKNKGVDKIFRHNYDIVFYDDWRTLEHRSRYYLKNVHARQEIEKNARKTTLQAHTYKVRAHQILRILAENGLK